MHGRIPTRPHGPPTAASPAEILASFATVLLFTVALAAGPEYLLGAIAAFAAIAYAAR